MKKAPDTPQTGRKAGRSQTAEWFKTVVWSLLLFFVLRTFAFETFRIISGSLEPTFLVGDWLIANKALYGAEVPFTGLRTPALREPRPGDIVLFRGVEDPDMRIVKRVIGIAGDTLAMRHDSVFRNGAYLSEPYAHNSNPAAQMSPPEQLRSREWQLSHLIAPVDRAGYLPDLRNWGPFVIPDGYLFGMGDNRDLSYDCRYWGFLPRNNVIGHPVIIYYSYDPEHWRPMPFLTALRLNRLLRRPR